MKHVDMDVPNGLLSAFIFLLNLMAKASTQSHSTVESAPSTSARMPMKEVVKGVVKGLDSAIRASLRLMISMAPFTAAVAVAKHR